MKDVTTAYQETLDYLYSFVDYSLTRSFRFTPDKFDLGRMGAFLALLGDPHKKYPVIHVAGTKGKGSTAALIASGLSAAGYRVGFYTSPHLQEYTERIQVNGEAISPQQLVDLVEFVKPIVPQVERLTTFEITTAIGFLHFAQQGCDAGVIEVGLGGRLDATNTVDPLLSVITSISMDHVAILGDTLAKIAYEKAGIIKPGRPVVMAPQPEEARHTITSVAAERGCPLIEVGRDFLFEPAAHSLDEQSFTAWQAAGGGSPELEKDNLSMPLLGLHQVENGATAYAALKTAAELGMQISSDAIRRGFASVKWPGRFEVLRKDPLLIVDSAHNRDSALRLRQALDDYLPGRPVVVLFGASEDKDVDGMFAELKPRTGRLIATQSVHPRACEAGKLAAQAEQHGITAETAGSVEEGLKLALQRAGKDAAVVATGSLLIVAAVREIWQKVAAQVDTRSEWFA
jgi:dihydrofolate synthase / folylpolyglutamate synthase